MNFIAGALSGYSLAFEFSGAARGMQAETNSQMYAMGQRAGTGGSLATAITGVGLTNALLSRFGRAGISILKEMKFARPTTVLGKVGNYERVANMLGANYFHMSDEAWNALSKEEKWAKNQGFLDEAIARGDDFVLSDPAEKATGFFGRELEYMYSQGYRLSEDGTRLIKPQ